MTSVAQYHKDFWEFSLDRYGRDGVSAICLKLQDVCCADVNILLFCLWCGQQRLALEPQVITRLIEHEASQWHQDVVLPLRSVRKAMKGRSLAGNIAIVESLRNDIKRIEIQSEKLEQLSLASFLAELSSDELAALERGASGRDVALANASVYIRLIAPEQVGHVENLLNNLVVKCTK